MWAMSLDPAVIASIILAAAALLTAAGSWVTARRNAQTAVVTAAAAKTTAQTDEDDSYVNRSLRAMQETQMFLKDENVALRLTIERQRQEIEELHKELGRMRDRVSVLEGRKKL